MTKNKKTLLITFGCSWTYGVGSSYIPGMTYELYMQTRQSKETNDALSFRGVISTNLGFTNRNFSMGGASNAHQFRLAKEYFTSSQFHEDEGEFDRIIVLHGITSTARTEQFCVVLGKEHNFLLDGSDSFNRIYATHFYDHDHEVSKLELEMAFWDAWYDKLPKFKNFWFDTFNHHNYSSASPRLLFNQFTRRDLCSRLVELDNPDHTRGYHESIWRVDSDAIREALDRNLVNPISLHPTAEAHKKMADMIISELKSRGGI